MLSRVATWGSLLRQAAEAGLKLLTQQRERRAPAKRTSETTERSARPRHRRAGPAPHRRGPGAQGRLRPRPRRRGRPGRDRLDLGAVRGGRRAGQGPAGARRRARGPRARRADAVEPAERADDRNWVGIGAGRWDGEGRPSTSGWTGSSRSPSTGSGARARCWTRDRFDRVADELRALRLELIRRAARTNARLACTNARLAYETRLASVGAGVHREGVQRGGDGVQLAEQARLPGQQGPHHPEPDRRARSAPGAADGPPCGSRQSAASRWGRSAAAVSSAGSDQSPLFHAVAQ